MLGLARTRDDGRDYMAALIACAASMFSWPTSSRN
jgi:hypothetical protein